MSVPLVAVVRRIKLIGLFLIVYRVSYGLVVVPPSESLLFPASRGLLRRLVCPTNPAVVEPILLVDTGGDGMKFYTQRSLPAVS